MSGPKQANDYKEYKICGQDVPLIAQQYFRIWVLGIMIVIAIVYRSNILWMCKYLRGVSSMCEHIVIANLYRSNIL